MSQIADKTELDELTDKQRSIIEVAIPLTEFEDVDELKVPVAEDAGASKSYVKDVLLEYEHILEDLRDELEATDVPAEADVDELKVPVAEDAGEPKSYVKDVLRGDVLHKYKYILEDLRDEPEATDVPAKADEKDSEAEQSDEEPDEEPEEEKPENEQSNDEPESKPMSNSSDDQKSVFESERVDVPGRPSVHDKRTPKKESEIAEYACPYCEFTDPSERVVRTHVTRESDSYHKNHNAFIDQLYIAALDEHGEQIEDIESPMSKSFKGRESTDLIPSGVNPDSRAGEILAEAIRYPDKGASDIAEAVYGDRDQNPYVYSVLSKYLSTEKAEQRTDSRTENRKGWTDLTNKQRQVIKAWLENPDPDRTYSDIEESADVSTGYSRTVLDKYGYIADHIEIRLQTNALSLDDLTHDAMLPINFDNPAPSDGTLTAKTETAETKTEGETDTPPEEPAEAKERREKPEMLEVRRDRMHEFAVTISTLRESAEVDANISPKDSKMSVSARKTLHVIDQVESFIREVADENNQFPAQDREELTSPRA